MKKFLSMCLALTILVSLLPILPVSAQEDSMDFSVFESYLKGDVLLEDDGYIGIPVRISTYYKGAASDEMTQVILYVINHAQPRVGMEDDIRILSDFLDEGYIVQLVDYQNNPKAVSPGLDWSLQKLRIDMNDNGSYMCGLKYRPYYNYIIPAGYRLERDVKYWSFDEHASVGTKERIVEIWNNEFMSLFGEKYNLKPAKTIEDCHKPDGSPLDLDLRMDIIYPSMPKEDVGVLMQASSAETRVKIWSHYANRPHLTGALFAGCAGVIYDHAYVPMARDDHYGYFVPCSLDQENGVKAHTAAMRLVRYLSNTSHEKYAFDSERIGVQGHSKMGYAALLSDPDANNLNEKKYYTQTHPEQYLETYGAQPWMTYPDGSEISGGANVLYTSGAGKVGALFYEDSCPVLTSTGENDDYPSSFSDIMNGLRTHDVVHLGITMPGIGHDLIQGMNPYYNIDNYQAYLDFMTYYLCEDVQATLVYATPNDGAEKVEVASGITLQFSAPIEKAELSKVQVRNMQTGETVKGHWFSDYAGGTRWIWYADTALDYNATYQLTVPDDIRDAQKQLLLKQTATRTFTTEKEKVVPAIGGGTADYTLGTSKDVQLRFDGFNRADGQFVKLHFSVQDDAYQVLDIYATEDMKNAIASVVVSGAGEYSVDLADYFEAHPTGDVPSFVVKARYETDIYETVYFNDFEGNFRYGKEFIRGGVSKNGYATDAQAYSGKKSAALEASGMWARIKFMNLLGTDLDADDIGKTYKITYYAKGGLSKEIRTGFMGGLRENIAEAYAKQYDNFYGVREDYNAPYDGYATNAMKTIRLSDDTWTAYEYIVTLTQAHVFGGVNCFALDTGAQYLPIFYVDDLKSEYYHTPVTIDNPRLVYTPVDGERLSLLVSGTIDEEYPNLTDDSATLRVNGVKLATEDTGAKKGYVQFNMPGNAGSAMQVNLDFYVKSKGSKKVQIYMLSDADWKAEAMDWATAPANDVTGSAFTDGTLVGEVHVDGAGDYSVDVTEAVRKAAQAGKRTLTFALSTEQIDGTPISSIVFDDMNVAWRDSSAQRVTSISSRDNANYHSYVYRWTGGPLGVELSQDDHTSGFGKSFLFKAQYNWDAVKFFNTFDRELTMDDVGRTFKISLWMKSNYKGDVQMGLRSPTGTYVTTYADSMTAKLEKEDTWQLFDYTVTITENMVADENSIASMLAIVPKGLDCPRTQSSAAMFDHEVRLWIDDIHVTEYNGDDVVIAPFEKEAYSYVQDFEAYKSSMVRPGGAAKITSKTGENHTPDVTDGKCISVTATKTYDRIKFYNTTAELTQKDIGTPYEISFYMKSPVAGKFYAGLMAPPETYGGAAAYQTAYYAPQTHRVTYEIEADTWTKYTYKFTVDEEIVAGKVNMLTLWFVALGENADSTYKTPVEVLIDDLHAVSMPEAEENADKRTAFTMQLKASDGWYNYMPTQETYVSDTVETIEDGQVVIGSARYSGSHGVKKGVLVFDKANHAETRQAVLKLHVEKGGDQPLYVYGLKRITDVNAAPTWNSLIGNDQNSTGVADAYLYGAAPIAKIENVAVGTHEIDVSDFILALEPNEYACFILATDAFGGVDGEEDAAYTLRIGAAATLSVLKSQTAEWNNPFADVLETDWYYGAVRYANEKGLFSGTSANTFEPESSLTRGMLVTVLYRAEGKPAVAQKSVFSDVPADAYYADPVAWAAQSGIVNGTSDTTFSPEENITREQIAAIMYRYAKYKQTAPQGAWAIRLDYADLAQISDYALEAVMYCKLSGLMQGNANGNFSPASNATRAEAAAILQRALEK